MMRNFFGSSFLALGIGLATSAAFAGEQSYDAAAFDAAVAAGKPVILDVSATWCPTCKQQKPIVEGLLKEGRYKPVTLYVADFDKEEALKKKLGVTMQSTFVVFKGGKEVGRSTGQTDKAAIAGLFDKAL